MTPARRNALLTACAFAKVYLDAADAELRGGSSAYRQEAGDQLAAALRNLEPEVYNPDLHKSSTQPYPQHIDSDRHRGPSDWSRECQESRRLNR